ncbi:MAG TPA: methyltransferase domain-containing protein [bacterium]|nr:methyltransferase domain-containing protein [bacterium]
MAEADIVPPAPAPPAPARAAGRGTRFVRTRRQAQLLDVLAIRGYEHLLLLGATEELLLAAGACARQVTATGLAEHDGLTARLRERRLRAQLLPARPRPAALPFPDGAFDGVLIPDGLESSDDLEGDCAGLARVCRAGGMLVLGSPVLDRLARIPLPFVRRGPRRACHAGEQVIQALVPYFVRDRLMTFPPIMPAGSALFYVFRCLRAGD